MGLTGNQQREVIAMWGGVLFIVIVITCIVLAAYVGGTIQRPRLRKGDRPQSPPITGMEGDSRLPRL